MTDTTIIQMGRVRVNLTGMVGHFETFILISIRTTRRAHIPISKTFLNERSVRSFQMRMIPLKRNRAGYRRVRYPSILERMRPPNEHRYCRRRCRATDTPTRVAGTPPSSDKPRNRRGIRVYSGCGVDTVGYE